LSENSILFGKFGVAHGISVKFGLWILSALIKYKQAI